AARVAQISRGEPPFHEPGLAELLRAGIAAARLRATADTRAAVAMSAATLIAVGTPDADGQIDLGQVAAAARAIGAALRAHAGYHVVAVKSTVVPGTTDTLVRRALEEASGRHVGVDLGLCVNPEFLREGAAVSDFVQPDRIVIGQWDEMSGRTLAELYAGFDCPKLFTTLRNAEMIKYASNALLATLISFSNELAALCEAAPGSDVETVMDGVHLDRRLTPVVEGRPVRPGILDYLRGGCGFGGSCLPKDLSALRTFARAQAVPTPLLDAVLAVNAARADALVDLAERGVGALAGRAVAVLGLAFKPGTDDLRDSPSLAVVDRLRARGAVVRTYDPLVSAAALPFDGAVAVCSCGADALAGADAAVIATAWPEFALWDWRALSRTMRRPVVIDGRGALRGVALPPEVVYLPLGRGAGETP
ncbi:MAG: UDP-glucose/GDP-mannose dehydrogenase family protein, partial [Chloroflexi bacterium]|nr:UDP-glucose/GDP-mannose dehydrogenase family protein [Chloroflexota bacterium]